VRVVRRGQPVLDGELQRAAVELLVTVQFDRQRLRHVEQALRARWVQPTRTPLLVERVASS